MDGYPLPANGGNVLLPFSTAKISLRLPPTLDGEKARAAIQPFPLQMHHYAEGELPASAAIKTAGAGPRGRHGRGVRHAARQVRHVAHAARAGAKRHAVHPGGGKRAVHVASLKKR